MVEGRKYKFLGNFEITSSVFEQRSPMLQPQENQCKLQFFFKFGNLLENFEDYELNLDKILTELLF